MSWYPYTEYRRQQQLTNPDKVNTCGAINAWAVNTSDITYIQVWMNDPSSWGTISELFTDHSKFIRAIKAFPMTLTPYMWGTKTQITMGNLTVQWAGGDVTGYPIKKLQTVAMFTIGHKYVSGLYNGSYLDYEPYTEYKIYAPYVGYIDVMASEIVSHTIKLVYAVDLLTGTTTAYVVIADNDASEYRVLAMKTGNISVDISLSASNDAEIMREVVTRIANLSTTAVTSAVTGNPLPLLTGAVGAIAPIPKTASLIGNIGDASSWCSPCVPYLIRTTSEPYISASFGRTIGRLSGYTRDLSDLTGFTKVRSVHIEGSNYAPRNAFNTALSDEISEIESLLREGVIL